MENIADILYMIANGLPIKPEHISPEMRKNILDFMEKIKDISACEGAERDTYVDEMLELYYEECN